jgi:hypothetical protein
MDMTEYECVTCRTIFYKWGRSRIPYLTYKIKDKSYEFYPTSKGDGNEQY